MPLSVCGTGITGPGQITLQTRTAIEQADKIFYLIAEPLTKEWVVQLRPDAIDLHRLYEDKKLRLASYSQMVEAIMEAVREDLNVCALFYGHPGVFVMPSHMSIACARKEGYDAIMLPGISAADCMFADLGFDPARYGCQQVEATDLLVYNRLIDPSCDLIIWQIGCVGNLGFAANGYNLQYLPILIERLLKHYPADHKVVVYEAAAVFGVAETVSIIDLPKVNLTAISTLYVPPAMMNAPDMEMVKRLGIDADQFSPYNTLLDLIRQAEVMSI